MKITPSLTPINYRTAQPWPAIHRLPHRLTCSHARNASIMLHFSSPPIFNSHDLSVRLPIKLSFHLSHNLRTIPDLPSYSFSRVSQDPLVRMFVPFPPTGPCPWVSHPSHTTSTKRCKAGWARFRHRTYASVFASALAFVRSRVELHCTVQYSTVLLVLYCV